MSIKKLFMFTTGAVFGGVVGAVLALLFAPTTGKELRSGVINYSQQTVEQVKQAGQAKRLELEQQLAALRMPPAK